MVRGEIGQQAIAWTNVTQEHTAPRDRTKSFKDIYMDLVFRVSQHNSNGTVTVRVPPSNATSMKRIHNPVGSQNQWF